MTKIEAGKYYRTKGGQVFGPMVIDADPVRVKPLRLGAEVCAPCWTAEGAWHYGRLSPFDLVAEVYVSDTPPAPQVNTTKTARDELVEKAALAILEGYYGGATLPLTKNGFAEIWREAELFVEAREK